MKLAPVRVFSCKHPQTKSLIKYSKIKVLKQQSDCLFRCHKIEGRSVDSHFHFRIFILFTLNMLSDTRNITSKQL